nr:CotH kinase family protein [Siphonobacter sp. SORGH_AS_0500]
MHGGCSSSIFRKSLRLYSDSEFDYPLFTDRPSTLAHKRLILRSGGNDYKYSLLTDAFMQKMVRHLPVATQANRAAVVFLNGEYWGVHTLDERYDKYYFNKLYRVATDSLDLLTLSLGIEVDEGDQTTYDAFYNYFANNNPVNYTYVKTLMDVENFTDYYIAEIFSSNTDWPHNNQVLWRKRVTPGTPTNHYGNDGRWRWALKDMDYGLGLMNQSNHNTLATATDNGVFGGYTRYLRRLLDIDEFKVYFINRFADLLNTTFNPTRTSAMLTEMKNEYSPAMQEHFTRWPEGNTYQGWLTNVEKIRTFIQQRPDFVREHIRNKFGLPANYNLTLGVSNTEQGYIKINTIELVPSTAGVSQNPYPWTGSYFQGNPIKVTARSRVGYKFMHWKEANTIISTDSVYTIASLNSARSLEAVFASDAVIKVTPTPYALAQCDYRMESWSSSATAGTYPPHMQFVHMSTEDPTLVATVADTVLGLYNHTSRTRLNGLNENGFPLLTLVLIIPIQGIYLVV